MQIITNHQYRDIIDWHNLTNEEQSQFEGIACICLYDFFRYKGRVYIVSDFDRVPDNLSDWDGCLGDSYFSGVLIKLNEFNDAVKCATYIS